MISIYNTQSMGYFYNIWLGGGYKHCRYIKRRDMGNTKFWRFVTSGWKKRTLYRWEAETIKWITGGGLEALNIAVTPSIQHALIYPPIYHVWHACACKYTVCMWRMENDWWELVLSFPMWLLEIELRLLPGSKHLHLLSHLVGLVILTSKKWWWH